MRRRAAQDSTDHKLTEEVSGSFFGTSPAGHHVMVIPIVDERPPLDRATGSVALSFQPKVLFELRRMKFEAPAAILTCLSETLGTTFRVLAEDIATRVDAKTSRPTARLVSRLFGSWEELLRRRLSLSNEEEIGLWGELWFLLQAPNIDRAIAAWRGPSGDVIDFVGGGIGVECKTTMRKLEHHFSQNQLTRALGDLPVYFLSIWVDRDEIGGRTLNDIAEEVAKSCADRADLEKLLLAAGYSREDAALYHHRLRVLEAPLWFEQGSIPRVREADPGVSSIRFLATLDESLALSPERGIALLAQLSGEANG